MMFSRSSLTKSLCMVIDTDSSRNAWNSIEHNHSKEKASPRTNADKHGYTIGGRENDLVV